MKSILLILISILFIGCNVPTMDFDDLYYNGRPLDSIIEGNTPIYGAPVSQNITFNYNAWWLEIEWSNGQTSTYYNDTGRDTPDWEFCWII